MYTADRFMPTRGQIKNAALVDVPIGTPDTSVHYDPVSAAISVGGALIGASGARSAARTQAAASDRAAQMAYEQSLPWDITAPGAIIGTDEKSKALTAELSPELQTAYQRALGRSGLWGDQISALMLDPFAAQQRIYEQQQALFAPEQERERLALENRLLAQGMLGSTGGALQSQALSEAQGTQNLQRQIAAMTQAQGLIDTYLGREQADIGQAMGFLDVPLQYGNLSRGIGASLAPAAMAGAQLRATGAQNLADTQAAISYGLGNRISNLGSSGQSGMFGSNPFTVAAQYNYNPFSGQGASYTGASGGYGGGWFDPQFGYVGPGSGWSGS